jgi:hypothetical protein
MRETRALAGASHQDSPTLPALAVAPEPTLAELLTRFVRTTVSLRLYQILQLGIPFAVDFGVRGWWRLTGWAIAIAAFGAWGLADRWIWTSEDEGWRSRVVRAARSISGVLAGGIPAVLLLELFLRVLGRGPIS